MFISGCKTSLTFDREVTNAISNLPDSLVRHFPHSNELTILGYSYRKRKEYTSFFGKSLEVVYQLKETAGSDIYSYVKEDLKGLKIDKQGKFQFYGQKDNIAFDGVVIYNDSIPLPSFRSVKYILDIYGYTLGRLPDDFNVYSIDAKKGVFIDKNELINDNIVPEPWQHGYSLGYAVSNVRNILVVWLTYW